MGGRRRAALIPVAAAAAAFAVTFARAVAKGRGNEICNGAKWPKLRSKASA